MLTFGLTTPVQAAALNRTFDCSILTTSQGIGYLVNLGDTVTFSFPNCIWKSATSYFPSAPASGTPWAGTETVTVVGPIGTQAVLQLADMADRFILSVQFRVSNPPPPAPVATPAADPAPSVPHVRQGLPMPASGDCKDIQDAEFAWGTGLTGGWERSWSTWRRENGEIFHDGPSCIRVMEHVDGVWRIADRRHY